MAFFAVFFGETTTIRGFFGMLSLMAKRKQSAKSAEEKDEKKNVLFVRLPDAVSKAFIKMVEEDPLELGRQAHGLNAVIALLESKGFWPPPKS